MVQGSCQTVPGKVIIATLLLPGEVIFFTHSNPNLFDRPGMENQAHLEWRGDSNSSLRLQPAASALRVKDICVESITLTY